MVISIHVPRAWSNRLKELAARLEARTPKESLGWSSYTVLFSSYLVLSFTGQTVDAARRHHLDHRSAAAHVVLTFWTLIVMAMSLALTFRFNPSQCLRVFWSVVLACVGAAVTIYVCFPKIS